MVGAIVSAAHARATRGWQRVGLRAKTQLVVYAALLAVVGALHLIASLVLGSGFEVLERRVAEEAMIHAVGDVDRLRERVETTAGDWARGGELAAVPALQAGAVLHDRFRADLLRAAGIDDVVVANAAGATLFAAAYDDEHGALADVPRDLAEAHDRLRAALAAPGAPEALSGIVLTADGPLMVAMRRVVPDGGDGEAPGRTLLLGARVDARRLADVQRRSRVTLSLDVAAGAGVRADVATLVARMPFAGGVLVEPLDDGTLRGATVLRDVWGRPAVLAQARLPRMVAAQSRASFHRLLVFTLMLTVTIMLLTHLVLGRLVIRPLEQLSQALRRVAAAGDAHLRVPSGGADELGELTDAVNAALGAIEHHESVLREAKENAEAANRATSNFLAHMSHELRNPINVILGFSDMLRDTIAEQVDRQAVTDLEQIRGAGLQLLEMVNDVLDSAKIEAGRIELRPAPVEVRTFVDDLAASAGALMTRQANALVIDCDASVGTLVTDPLRLRQMLMNLLSNAAKFTDHGTVTLRASTQGDDIVFTVSDTGVGMTPEQLSHLFEPFYQAGNGRAGVGTGLGLAITRRFCRLMGGSIEVTSEPRVGSSFQIVLPRRPPRRPADATAKAA